MERRGIGLFWDKDPKATSYEIYRSTDNMEPVIIGTSSSGTYTDTKVKSGKYYTYSLIAVSGKKKSVMSEGNTFYFLKPLEILKIRSAGGSVTLSWKKVKGASGYQIRYGTNKSFKSARQITIKNQKTLQKTIHGLKKKNYYFQIRAIKKSFNMYWYSAWSKAKICRVK